MIGHLLTSSADVFRPSHVGDGRGGRTRSFVQINSVLVKVNQPSVAEEELAARQGATLAYRVHMSAGEDVRRDDELDVGGRRLRVIGVVSDSHGTYKRADCEVVQVGQ